MSRKSRALLIGTVAGALLGASVAWVIGTQNEERGGTALEKLGPSDLFQLGIGILTLARQFGAMLQKP